MPRILRRIVVVVLAGVLVVLVTAIGTGRIRYVSTHGVSMIPTYHDGELVVVADADTYGVGDIAAYRNPSDGRMVLHRIVGGSAGGWNLRGDNNQSMDVAHPTSRQLLGRAVMHVAGLGRAVSSPLAMSIGGAAAVVLLLGIVSVTSHRRLRSRRAAMGPPSITQTDPFGSRRRVRWSRIGLVATNAVIAAGMAAALLFPVHTSPPSAPMEQRGTFRYGASAPKSETYPDGQVVTGDPVFTRLVTRVSVEFQYGTDATAPDVSGMVGLELQVANRTGWRRLTELVPPGSISGGAITLRAEIDLGAIQAQIDRVAEESGVPSAGVDIVIIATAHVTVADRADTTTAFELPLQLTPTAMSLVNSGATAVAVADTGDGPAVVVQHPIEVDDESTTSGLINGSQRRVIFFALLGAVAVTVALWPSSTVAPEPEPEPEPEPDPDPDSDPDSASEPQPALEPEAALGPEPAPQPERRRGPRTGHATGSFPDGIACDGRTLWVANSGSNTVSQIDPLARTRTDHTTGEGPRGIALDGTHVWVANADSNTISRIHPGTGVRNDFRTGGGPQSVTHDGTHVWVTNSRSNTVSRIDPHTGQGAEYVVGPHPSGIAFDGWYVWVANFGNDTVTRLDPHQPSSAAGVHYAVGPNPMGVAFDGQHIWVANFGGDSVSQIDPRDAAPGRAVHHQVGLNPRGLVWDGTSMWVTNFSSGTVSKIDPAGAEPGTAVSYATGSNPCGISSDGTSVWITNFSANTVSVIHTRQSASAELGPHGDHRIGS